MIAPEASRVEYSPPPIHQEIDALCGFDVETGMSVPGNEQWQTINLVPCSLNIDATGKQVLTVSPLPAEYPYLSFIKVNQSQTLVVASLNNITVDITSFCSNNIDRLSGSVGRSLADALTFLFHKPGITNSMTATGVCYDASSPGYQVELTDQVFLEVDGPSQAIFETVGSQLKIGDQLVTPEEIYESLQYQLSIVSGREIELQLFEGQLNLRALKPETTYLLPTSTPEPTVEVSPTRTKVEPTPTPAPAPTRQEIVEAAVETLMPRDIIGKHLSITLESNSVNTFKVYQIQNFNSALVKETLLAYQQGTILTPDQSDLLGELSQRTKPPSKLVNWWLKLRGKELITQDTFELPTQGRLYSFDEVLVANQTETFSEFLVRNGTGYFIIRGNSRYLDQLTFQLTDDFGVIDQQGSRVISNVMADVTVANSSAYGPDFNQDLFVTPSQAVSGMGTGQNIALVSESFPAEPGLIPWGLSGQYGGRLYLDPKTQQLFVAIDYTDVTGTGVDTETYYVPVGYIDSSPN